MTRSVARCSRFLTLPNALTGRRSMAACLVLVSPGVSTHVNAQAVVLPYLRCKGSKIMGKTIYFGVPPTSSPQDGARRSCRVVST
jgi:hypothetical protein